MKINIRTVLAVFALILGAFFITNAQTFANDFHSYANPNVVKVTHVDLDWTVLFDQKTIKGSATLTIESKAMRKIQPLILDTRDLNIEKIETSINGTTFKQTTFELGTADKILGSSLTIQLPDGAKRVRIFYSTSPNASGLQWLEPQQTAG